MHMNPKKNRALSRKVLLGLASMAAVSAVQADTTWTGSVSQDWTNASNWNNGVPNAGNADAFVNTATGNYPILSSAATAGRDIRIGAGSNGRLDHTAGLLSTGEGSWFFLGYLGAQSTYNLANTAGTGGALTGFGQGSGSLNVGGSLKSGNLFVGLDAGTSSTLNVHTTGTLAAGGIFLGSAGASSGTLNVDSGTVTASGELQVGASYFSNGGTGTLRVGGGSVTANIISFARGTNASAAITGTGTFTGGTVSSKQWFTLGFAGGATNVSTVTNSGAAVNVNTSGGGNMELGVWDPTVNTFTQNSGSLSLQNNASIVFGVLGHTGQSTFNQNGGTVTFFSDGGSTTGGTGALNLGSRGANSWEVSSGTYAYNLNGGTLLVPKIQKTSGNGTGNFVFNGGTLSPTASSTTFMQGISNAYVKAGGAIIDTNGFDITVGQALLTDSVSTGGGLTKSGAGTLALTGANTFTGNITVNAGTLSINSAFINDSANVSLFTGSVFDLGFVGSDSIGYLYINGASQAIGTYGGIGSGATFESSFFTGTGMLNVTSAIPEPASFAAFGGLAALVLVGARRRRR